MLLKILLSLSTYNNFAYFEVSYKMVIFREDINPLIH